MRFVSQRECWHNRTSPSNFELRSNFSVYLFNINNLLNQQKKHDMRNISVMMSNKINLKK